MNIIKHNMIIINLHSTYKKKYVVKKGINNVVQCCITLDFSKIFEHILKLKTKIIFQVDF